MKLWQQKVIMNSYSNYKLSVKKKVTNHVFSQYSNAKIIKFAIK